MGHLAGRPHVPDVVALDARGLADLQRAVLRALEGRGGGHADEQHRDPDVDEVAAPPPAVAAHERERRRARTLAGHRPPRAHAAHELLAHRAEDERDTREEEVALYLRSSASFTFAPPVGLPNSQENRRVTS